MTSYITHISYYDAASITIQITKICKVLKKNFLTILRNMCCTRLYSKVLHKKIKALQNKFYDYYYYQTFFLYIFYFILLFVSRSIHTFLLVLILNCGSKKCMGIQNHHRHQTHVLEDHLRFFYDTLI